MIPELRRRFNDSFTAARYADLQTRLEEECSPPESVAIYPTATRIGFRIAETPVFVPESRLREMADEGAKLARSLIAAPEYLSAARAAIPAGYRVANETAHPNFLTADFALVHPSCNDELKLLGNPMSPDNPLVEDSRDQGTGIREEPGKTPSNAGRVLVPKLVEMQAFPSVYGLQAALCSAYRWSYTLDQNLNAFLGGLNETRYWKVLAETIVGEHDPENVALTEIDPRHQKTLPDFNVTARKLGIAVIDITSLEAVRDKLHYRNAAGKLVPIHRIYNRAIADELIARGIELPFDLTRPWNVEWAGHPNWYFLISKFSVPWLAGREVGRRSVPPAVFADEFLEGDGRERLADAGVALPPSGKRDAVYGELLLKPLFSFAGKGILFEPTQADLEAIPRARRREYLLQQRMRFVPTIETPQGMTQAEFRILYLWPDSGELTPVLSLVRLGRGKMMGVDHNRNQEWVGASAAFHRRD